MAEGVMQHHLEKLESAGLVEVLSIVGMNRVYPAGKAPKPENWLLESGAYRRVAELILARPGLSSVQIAEEMGVSKRMALKYLDALLTDGLVAVHGGGKYVTYHPAARLSAALRERRSREP